MSNDLANPLKSEVPNGPLRPQPASPLARGESETSPTGTTPKKLLIIEDDLFIRELYKGVFTESGYLVDLAIDGQEALEKINSRTYDMILLDLVLPKITGIDLLRTCREPSSHARNTPIFLITNLGQENIIKEAFKIGADGYILKAQVTPKDLVREIDTFFAAGQKSTP